MNKSEKYRKHYWNQCEVCKKKFHPFRRGQKFCSYKCAARGRFGRTRYNPIKLKCKNCGREFFRPKSNVKRFRFHFCSPKCYALFQKKSQKGKLNYNWRDGKTAMRKSGDKKKRLKGINTKRIGIRAEREVRKILQEWGYFVARSSASLGPWDVWAVNEKKLRLIQVKATKERGKPEVLFRKELKQMRSIVVNGQQELWVRRTGKPVKTLLERYEIVEIKTPN